METKRKHKAIKAIQARLCGLRDGRAPGDTEPLKSWFRGRRGAYIEALKVLRESGIFLLLFILAAGCSTRSQHIVTGATRSALVPDQVEVRPSPPAGAVEIGIVTATTGGQNETATKTAIAALKREATGIGANVIVIIGADLATHESGGGFGYSFGSPGFTYTPSATARETKLQAKAYYAKN
jgi:hypothetical protein